MRSSVLAALTAVAAALGGCGPAGPALRLSTDPGVVWTYDAHRQDEWADGFGGVLETRLRLRLVAEDGVPGRAARYATTIESLAVDSPPRFGVHLDTTTPGPEPRDALDVETLARGLLGRRGEVTISAGGVVSPVEPDRELRERLTAWRQGRDKQATVPVVTLLDELLDGPRVASRWLQAAGLLLPPDAFPAAGEPWTRTVPPATTPAGRLACELTVRHEPAGADRVTLRAEGAFHLAEPQDGAAMRFVSGSLRAEAELDTRRGVFTRYHEVTEFALENTETGEPSTARWTRTLTLVE